MARMAGRDYRLLTPVQAYSSSEPFVTKLSEMRLITAGCWSVHFDYYSENCCLTPTVVRT
jgi:hypothetical protein